MVLSYNLLACILHPIAFPVGISILMLFCSIPSHTYSQVVHIQRSIPDFSTRNFKFCISQANPDLLTALEEFEVKIMNYEHMLRYYFFSSAFYCEVNN